MKLNASHPALGILACSGLATLVGGIITHDPVKFLLVIVVFWLGYLMACVRDISEWIEGKNEDHDEPGR